MHLLHVGEIHDGDLEEGVLVDEVEVVGGEVEQFHAGGDVVDDGHLDEAALGVVGVVSGLLKYMMMMGSWSLQGARATARIFSW